MFSKTLKNRSQSTVSTFIVDWNDTIVPYLSFLDLCFVARHFFYSILAETGKANPRDTGHLSRPVPTLQKYGRVTTYKLKALDIT